MSPERNLLADALRRPGGGGRVSRKDATWLVVVALVVAALLSWLPWLSWVDYPFRLLLTIVHELGHGITALATGGRFLRFVIFPDGSGVAYSAGGWRLLIVPAGYLTAATFGAGLILLGRSPRASRLALAALGLVVGLTALRYGLPSLLSADAGAGLLTTASGLTFGLGFLWVAMRATAPWIVFLTHLVAFQATLDAFSDLNVLIGLASSGDASGNDARTMAEVTGLPALLWAGLWGLAALLLVGAAMRAAWLRSGR